MGRGANVVLVVADQWRGDCLSSAGHPVVRTPYLDALGRSGARFERAYSATPTCVPARMALLTGLRQESHRRVGYADGVTFDITDTLPRAFSRAGYATQAVGKMHYYPERSRLGFDDVLLHDGYLHFARKRGTDSRYYDDYLTWLRQQAGESAVADYADDGVNCNSVVARPWNREERLHPTNWVVEQGIEWLYRRDPTRPFFLYLSFHRPHPPYNPPAWAFEQYLPGALAGAVPDEVLYHSPPVGSWTDIVEPYRDDLSPDSNVARYDQATLDRARAGYYGNMTHIDHQVNRFREALAEFDLADDTYVMFTSDHGEMLGDHDLWRKGYPYEGSARVPMLLTGPGIAPGQVVDPLVELRDVMPTLLDCAGVDVPDAVEGRSLLSSLAVQAADDGGAGAAGAVAGRSAEVVRAHLHGEHTLFGQSIQWILLPGWKYVWWSGTGREQLFDLATDPEERHDLAGPGAGEPVSGAARDVRFRARALLVAELAGREEGFVADGALVAGRPTAPVLRHPHVVAAEPRTAQPATSL